MATKVLLVCVALVASSACAGGGAPSAGPAPQAATPQPVPGRRDASLITREDLSDPAIRSLNVIEAIRVLRPNFLASRGTQTIVTDQNRSVTDPESGQVHASIDDSGVLAVDELKRIQAGTVREIRLLSPAAAMQRFGATAKQGPVIAVRTM